jgi:acyl-CoA dehydrogenase
VWHKPAAGRAISLPSTAVGATKILAFATGTYARIRRQFNLPIGRFEGIEAPLARIGTSSYLMDAVRTFAAATIDAGEKPSVASAIVKYHVTELGRKASLDAMDIHGGKGICLGPRNYLGRGYQAAPIAITVEGANILTRNLIIFGQGAIRCHPYVLGELEAAKMKDQEAGLIAFDGLVANHFAFAWSNVFRSLILALTNGRFIRVPNTKAAPYLRMASRYSAALAMAADVSMVALGSDLKRKESISARLGDILSNLYILSAVVKYYHDHAEPLEDMPLVKSACVYCLFEIQQSFVELIDNYPNRWFAILLRVLVFPLGKKLQKPKDALNHKIAQLLTSPNATRLRLSEGAYLTPDPSNHMTDLLDAFDKVIAAESIEKQIRSAKRDNLILGYTLLEQAEHALTKGLLTEGQYKTFIAAHKAREKVIAVDDFAHEDLARHAI